MIEFDLVTEFFFRWVVMVVQHQLVITSLRVALVHIFVFYT